MQYGIQSCPIFLLCEVLAGIQALTAAPMGDVQLQQEWACKKTLIPRPAMHPAQPVAHQGPPVAQPAAVMAEPAPCLAIAQPVPGLTAAAPMAVQQGLTSLAAACVATCLFCHY